MTQEGTIVKSRNLIEKYLEVMGATDLYTVKGSILTPAEPEEKKPSEEEEILATRPRRKYVYNPRTKGFDVLIIKVEKRESESVSTALKKPKRERISKSAKLAGKVPIAWTTSKSAQKNFSVKKGNRQVHQPRLHN